jgi:hypothetical protein
MTAYPLFDASAYPPAPFTWRPPFPYELSMVRWPGQKAPEPVGQAELQPAREVPAVLASDFAQASISSSGNRQRQAVPQHA